MREPDSAAAAGWARRREKAEQLHPKEMMYLCYASDERAIFRRGPQLSVTFRCYVSHNMAMAEHFEPYPTAEVKMRLTSPLYSLQLVTS